MQLQAIDWVVVAVYGLASLLIGIVFTKRASRSLERYFLSGRKLPWWLLGTSMVATTFSMDTPNLVTDMVRNGGVSLNWWRRAVDTSGGEYAGNIAASFLAWFLGCLFVYATLFATGYLLYGRLAIGLVCAAVAIAAAFGLWRTIPKVGFWTA